jgi:hypothetical protein
LPPVWHADLNVGAAAPSLWLRGLAALCRRTSLSLGLSLGLPLGRLLWLLREERSRRQRQQHRSYTQNKTMWSHLAVS